MSGTQVVTKSSPTEGLAMADCVATIDQLSKKRGRKPSKPAGAEKVPTPAGAQSTPIPEANPGANVFQFVKSLAKSILLQSMSGINYSETRTI